MDLFTEGLTIRGIQFSFFRLESLRSTASINPFLECALVYSRSDRRWKVFPSDASARPIETYCSTYPRKSTGARPAPRIPVTCPVSGLVRSLL